MTLRSQMHYGWVILSIGMLIVMGAVGFARFGYSMILPAMRASLALNHDQTGLIASANFLGYLLFALFGGFLATRLGPRIVIFFSMLLAGITMVITGMVGGLGSAILTRFLTGVGSGGSNVPMMGLATAWFASRRRGMATGLLVGGSGLALMVAGYLVPRFTSLYPSMGWRYSWFILGGSVILLGLLGLILLRNHPSEKRLMPIGWSGDSPGSPGGPYDGREAPSTASFRSGWNEVLRIKGVPALATAYFCFGLSYIIYATYFVTFLVEERSFSQIAAGRIWALVGVLSIFSGLLWGLFSDFAGRKTGLVTVFLIQAISYLLLVMSQQSALIWLSAFLYGMTAWSVPGIVAATCGDLAGAKRSPAALGLVTFFLGIGQILGPGSAGWIEDSTSSFIGAFALATVIALLGALAVGFGSLQASPGRPGSSLT